jgi:hypothetical protein
MNPRRPTHHLKKDFRELGHYAVGTANLIPTSSLNQRFSTDLWSSSAQKPMLYYAVGGNIEEPDMGKGHRRTVAEVQSIDYTNYVKR